MNNKFYYSMKFYLLLAMFAVLNYSANACHATFTYNFACAGDTIFFRAVDQNAVYTWDFGDTASGTANISHDTNSCHVYMNPGTYYVSLFVSDGDEWDCHTHIIHVGADCFNAAFSTMCGGSYAFYFNNESVGHYSSVSWNFGDPASGTNDTSTYPEPYHMYSGPGQYTVTMIISNSSQSDTVIHQINVQYDCIDAELENLPGRNCFQDSTIMAVSYVGYPVSYLWDFGDPATGAANTSTDSVPVHQFSAVGNYQVTLILSDSFQTDTFYFVQNIIDCTVWPGNANRDGQVNMDDIFAIGIFYGHTGTSRQGASINWSSQPSMDWSTDSTGLMYLQDLVDEKNADCNGDGIINSLDVSAISQNYGMLLPNYTRNDKMVPVSIHPSDPVLEMIPGINTYTAGDTVNVNISLSNTSPGATYYGLSARIYYDQSFVYPGSMSVNFNQCWMGTPGTDLIGLYNNSPLSGYVDFGIVRTNQQATGGNGTVATLQFVLKSNLSGSMNFSIDPAVRLINNGVNSNEEIFKPVNVVNSSLQIVIAWINEVDENTSSIYPNPFSNLAEMSISKELKDASLIIYDVVGHINGRLDHLNGSSIYLERGILSEGIYFYEVIEGDRSVVKGKFIVE